MTDHAHPANDVTKALDCARAAEEATRQLCRATQARSGMTPAEVDTVLTHLAHAVAALPQAARQLADILEHASDHHVLQMDTLTDADDPHLALATARAHLDAAGEPALGLYRLLDTAHQHTAHVGLAHRTAGQPARRAQDFTSYARHSQDRQPPPLGSHGPVPGHPR